MVGLASWIDSLVARPRLLDARGRRHLARVLLTHAALVASSALVLVPFLWMLSTSLKPYDAVFLYPPQLVPNPISFGNYVEALTAIPYRLFFRNTIVITLAALVGELISSSLVAYSFARLRWWGRDVVFVLVLATMMLPQQVTLIPRFVLFRQLGWIDSFLPLIVPSFFGVPLYVFLLRQFYLGLPLDLDDAARIDGCGSFLIYWRVLLPLSRAALAVVAIFSFQYHWNDFLEPLIYLHSYRLYTVSLALQHFLCSCGSLWHLLMAASATVMAPSVVLFFVAQRYFIQGARFPLPRSSSGQERT